MGGCLSRVSDSDRKKNIEPCRDHDDKFVKWLDLPYLENISYSKIETANQQMKVEKALEELRVDIQRMKQFADREKEINMNPSSKLLIEIQKGKDVFSADLCALNPQPYVQIEVFPEGLTFKTNPGILEIPTWNEFFDISVKSLQKIVFSLKFKLNLMEDSTLGTNTMEFSEISNQKIFEGIRKIKNTEIKPQISLKVQYVKEWENVEHHNIESSKRYLKEAENARRKLQKLLDEIE